MKKLIAILLLLVGTAQADPYTKWVTTKIPTTAVTYTTNTSVGGVITLTGLACGSSRGKVNSILLLDDNGNTNSAVSYQVFLFSKLPTGTISNNTAITVSDASLLNLVGRFECNASSGDSISFADNGFCSVQGFSSSVITESSDNTLYAIVRTDGAPVHAGDDEFYLKAAVECQ